MTGIISFMKYGVPFVFSDTLLSSRVALNPNFIMPSASINRTNGEFVPTGMCQKIVILSKNLSYVWCGNLNEIIAVDGKIRKIIESYNGVWVTMDQIDLIQEIVKNVSNEVGILVLARASQFNFATIYKGIDSTNIDPFQFVMVGGSGGGEFYSELINISSRMSDEIVFEGMDKEKSDKLMIAGQFESVIQGKFVYNEYFKLGTGGIIESAIFDDESIDKGDNTLFLVWNDSLPYPFSIFPFLAIKRFYEGEYLYISYSNYYANRFNLYCIGHPGNLIAPLPIKKSRFNPLEGPINRAHTIRFSRFGGPYHRGESGKMILEHFKYSEYFRTIIFSDYWYQDFIKVFNESLKIEYPY